METHLPLRLPTFFLLQHLSSSAAHCATMGFASCSPAHELPSLTQLPRNPALVVEPSLHREAPVCQKVSHSHRIPTHPSPAMISLAGPHSCQAHTFELRRTPLLDCAAPRRLDRPAVPSRKKRARSPAD
ncbi:uncharacterized protein K452DRAFT_82293 [Aplosporella prunicola CBS 121167]|uniref:Secreted protein n=1 Tax=Aplosporella prunicola CBS 121167 TaxID=1176127 RepID=A0A6A6B4S1_9PEZI|nr:uncharacterized protein K452DRAFT_82293 [Aplosporella prunicola CBS 121167]KAF2139189.1 hypothetical protein K452DRAFT_82293 [Aplosporella prunicola CBS 121167]